jgi:hypothetical protein
MSMNNYLYGQAARLIAPQLSSSTQATLADSNDAQSSSNALETTMNNRNGASNGATLRLTSAQLDAAFVTINKLLDNPNGMFYYCNRLRTFLLRRKRSF